MQKIEQVQTKEYIAGILRNEILSGGLKPGQELAQEKLAELLGVSRMPVREALQTLAAEGFLERMPNRHMKVIELDERQVQESFFFLAQAEQTVFRILRKQAETEENGMKEVSGIFALLDGKGAESEGERELAFHLQALQLLDNAYIRQICGRLLQGYAAFVLKELPGEEPVLLRSLKEPWMADQQEKVTAILEEYYKNLAERLLLHWRENINE